MPKYFFDLDIGHRVIRDQRGTALSDDAAARESAVEAVPDTIRVMMATGETGKLTTIVRDEDGRVIFSLAMTQRCN